MLGGWGAKGVGVSLPGAPSSRSAHRSNTQGKSPPGAAFLTSTESVGELWSGSRAPVALCSWALHLQQRASIWHTETPEKCFLS